VTELALTIYFNSMQVLCLFSLLSLLTFRTDLRTERDSGRRIEQHLVLEAGATTVSRARWCKSSPRVQFPATSIRVIQALEFHHSHRGQINHRPGC